MMSVLPLLPTEELDFTRLTRTGMLLRAQYLFTQANPAWDDYSVAYVENLLLEGLATFLDLQRGTAEARVRENYPATMSDRLMAIRLARLVNWSLPGGTAATLTGSFSLLGGGAPTKNILLPEGIRVRTTNPNSPQRYRLTASYTWATTETYKSVGAENAELISETHEASGEPNQTIILTRKPLIDNTVTITAGNGVYSEYDTFVGVAATTRAFVVRTDDEGRGRIVFGSGLQGKLPEGSISIGYKIGGGTAGEVEANSQWIVEDTIYDVDGNQVDVVFTNATASQPGTDPMTVEEAAVQLPLQSRAIRALVIASDAETIATGIAGCDRALLLTSDEDSTFEENYAKLLCVGRGTKDSTTGTYAPIAPSQSVLDSIAVLLQKGGEYPLRQGMVLDVVAAPFKSVTLEMKVYKTARAVAADVAAAIRSAMTEFFAVTNVDGSMNTEVDFGVRMLGSDGNPIYQIPWSTIHGIAKDAAGVRKISTAIDGFLINGARVDLLLSSDEFPKLINVVIYDMDQNGQEI